MAFVVFVTLGCKLNQAETAMLTDDFLKQGYQIADSAEQADVGVVNTCTVTGRSASKCRQAVRRLLKKNPGMTVIVTGCYAQVDSQDVAALKGVDYVLGVDEKLNLFDFFPGPGKLNRPLIAVGNIDAVDKAKPHARGDFSAQTRAFLKIQNGCDRRCAYCIVPIARGPGRSLPEKFVVQQAEAFIADGFREIVLTGVHVGDYGKDLNDQKRSLLPDLLDRLASLPGLFRLRMSSMDPSDLTEGLIEVLNRHAEICRHFHIPVQSGSNAILQAMNRQYTVENMAAAIDMIDKNYGRFGLGADVIVGFPGETEAYFEETVRFIEAQPFNYLHVFPYSIRQGTAAAGMPGQISEKTKTERARRLRQIGFEKKKKWLAQWPGKTVDVLFESTCIDGNMAGYTAEYARVEMPWNEALVNDIFPVKIKKATPTGLLA